MRPKSIIWFEGLSLLTIALMIPHAYLTWDELISNASDIALDPVLVILISQGIRVG